MSEFELEGFMRLDTSSFLSSSKRASRSSESLAESVDDAAGTLATALVPSLGLAADSAEGLDDEMGDLSRSASRAEGSLEDAGRQAATTGGTFSALSLSTSGLSASFGIASSSLTSGLLPGLAALSTVTAPLLATVGGLASAVAGLAGGFGAVLGSGVLAFSEKRGEQNADRLNEVRGRIVALEKLQETNENLTAEQERELQKLREQEEKLEDSTGAVGGFESAMADLKEQLTPIIADFGQKFIPLIEDTIDAIPSLAENILDATGDLTAFRDALRGFGQQAARLLPRITDRLFDLGRRALPVLTDGLEFLTRNGGRIFEGMMQTTREIAPLLLRVGQSFASLVPEINAFGSAILKTALPAISGFFDNVGELVSGDIQGGLIDPITGIVDDTVAFLNSGKGQRLLDRISEASFNSLAAALNGTTKNKLGKVANALGGAIGDVITILSTNFEESGLGPAITRFAAKTMGAFSNAATTYVKSDPFKKDIRVIGGAVASSLFAATVAAIKESFKDFQLTDLLGGLGVAIDVGQSELNLSSTAPTSSQPALSPQPVAASPATGSGTQPIVVENQIKGDERVIEEVSAEVADERIDRKETQKFEDYDA